MGSPLPHPSEAGYSSDRRSILSSSTSNTRVAPPEGGEVGSDGSLGSSEKRSDARKGITWDLWGSSPLSISYEKCTKKQSEASLSQEIRERNKVSCGQTPLYLSGKEGKTLQF